MLWKSLCSQCSELIFTETVNQHKVEVFTPPLEQIIQEFRIENARI